MLEEKTMASVKFLGHASFEIELGGRIIYTDPWWDAKPLKMERLVPPGIQAESIRKADLIMISNEKPDHCDKFDVQRVQEKTFAQVLAPDPALAKLELNPKLRMTAYQGDSFHNMGLDITVTKAKQPQSQYPAGYIVSAEGKRVYFAGDTYDFFEMHEISVDVALLPIGGRETMDVISAVNALKMLKCTYVVPMHYNTFKMIQANVREFEEKAKKGGRAEPVLLRVGESFSF